MTDIDHSPSAPRPEPKKPQPGVGASAPVRRTSSGGLRPALIFLVLLALILGGALYYQQQQYRTLQADLLQQHNENLRLVQESKAQASQALAMAQQQAAQVEDLRSALDATSGQVDELEQALQMLTDTGSDLLLLNDIDRLVSIAQQQLALGGNVANAIISLESAQAQLARANRPPLAALQQSINGDLDRLRAVATINLPALSDQLDQLSQLVGSAPLLVPDAAAHAPSAPAAQAAVAPAPAAEPAAAGWQGALAGAWHWTRETASMLSQDLRGLFDVRRVDDPAALLMSPDQALRFREGLKQRILTAQLALMMHQSRIWQTELEQVAQAIDQRYDMHAETARRALKQARELHDTAIETQLPSLDNSLAAIAAAREAAAAAESGQNDASPEVGTPDAGSGSAGASRDGTDAPAILSPIQSPARPGTV